MSALLDKETRWDALHYGRKATVPAGIRTRKGGTRYLTAAACVALSTIMLLPLLTSVLASVKSTPKRQRCRRPIPAWPQPALHAAVEFQAGVLTYLGNSAGAAALTILFCLALTIPPATRWRASRFRSRKCCSSRCCWALSFPTKRC